MLTRAHASNHASTLRAGTPLSSCDLLSLVPVQGCEVAYGGLLATYTVDALSFTAAQGADVTSLFWGVFALGRAVAIPCSLHLSPKVSTVEP